MAPVCFFRTFVSLMVLFSVVTCGQADDSPTSALLETHPFQTNLVCKRAPGSFLKGQLFRLNGAQETLISTFTQGHVGNCELARRASRNGLVCVTAGSNYQAVRIETLESRFQCVSVIHTAMDVTASARGPRSIHPRSRIITDVAKCSACDGCDD